MNNQDSRLIHLEHVDSTNNYAMRLVNDDKAHSGMTIVADSQGSGRGQRGKTWTDTRGDSLLMSVIVHPRHDLSRQFVFNAAIAVSIVKVLQNFLPTAVVSIKWPNDIIIGDKKAGGILIENVLRGSKWTHSIIGLGLNVRQERFPEMLPNATSIALATGKDIPLSQLRDRIREHIMSATLYPAPDDQTMFAYNELLYRKNLIQSFNEKGTIWSGRIIKATADGLLELQKADNVKAAIYHGQASWEWPNG